MRSGSIEESSALFEEGGCSSCNTKEIIAYMRKEFDHDPQPHEMERALMRCSRIHKVGLIEIEGEPVSVWASEWDLNSTVNRHRSSGSR